MNNLTQIAIIEVTYTNYTENEIVYTETLDQLESIKLQSDFVSLEVIEGELEAAPAKITSGQRRRINTYFKKWSRKDKVEDLITEEESKDCEEYSSWKMKDLKKELSKLEEYVIETTCFFTEEMFNELEKLGFHDACLTYEEFLG